MDFIFQEMEASENPSLQSGILDPMLFCTASKKNRFYIFSTRMPDLRWAMGRIFGWKVEVFRQVSYGGRARSIEVCLYRTPLHKMHKVADRVVDFTKTLSVYVTRRYLHFITALIIPKILILQSGEQWSFYHFSGDSDRDVFNEKPSREEMLAATQVTFKNNRCTHVNLQMMLSYDNPLYGHKSVGFLFTCKNASVFYINFNNWIIHLGEVAQDESENLAAHTSKKMHQFVCSK